MPQHIQGETCTVGVILINFSTKTNISSKLAKLIYTNVTLNQLGSGSSRPCGPVRACEIGSAHINIKIWKGPLLYIKVR